jgi:hydroxypyruvate reductase 1
MNTPSLQIVNPTGHLRVVVTKPLPGTHWLDVFENEPATAPGLADLDNVVMAPHIASATKWTRESMASLAACNVAAILQGHPVAAAGDVRRFLCATPPPAAPSIVNAHELGLA